MWFNHKQDDGIAFSRNFGVDGEGIPIETIALVCTVVSLLISSSLDLTSFGQIENCIDEYQIGEHKETAFTGSSYKSRYIARVAYLQDVAKKTEQNSIIPRFRQRLLKLAR